MTNPNIRMGLQIPLFTYPDVATADLFERVAGIATTAEASGFDSVWVMDHFYQLPGLGAPGEPMFEAYSLLTALAARTRSVRLGCMVGGMTYRNPAFLAKQVTALDVISKGRAIWGIGAGWYENEYKGYGFKFLRPKKRIGMLREAVQIVRSMWTEEETTFDGSYYNLHRAHCDPKPLQSPYPPIWIGGKMKAFEEMRLSREGDRRRRFVELAAEHDRVLNALLSPEQRARLMQISIQSTGIYAFREPDIVQELGLSAEQRASCREIESELIIGLFGRRSMGLSPPARQRRPSWIML